MRNLIRKSFYAMACTVPVYANAAGLGTPVCSDDLPGIVSEARLSCTEDPLGCLLAEISPYGIENVVSDLSAASVEHWETVCLEDEPFLCDLATLQQYGLDTLVTSVSSSTASYCKENPDVCNIVVSDIIGSGRFGEIEPNNISTQATVLDRGVPKFGQTSSANDVDWFAIDTFDNNTAMNLWFPESTASWMVEVKGARGEVLARFPTVADGETQTNYLVQAPNRGRQYISISNPPGQLSQLSYQIAVHLTSSQGGEGTQDSVQYGEVEPNDIWTMATELTRDVPRFGQTLSLSDVDWYVTETYENNTLMNIWFPGSEDMWDVEVQDARGEILAKFSTVSDGVTQTNYQVHAQNAGKQYISVSSPPGRLSQLPYQVAVNLISAQGGEGNLDSVQFGEVEPNDNWTMATQLTRDVPRFGQTRSLSDVDWYVTETYENNTLMNIWFPGSEDSWDVEVQDARGEILATFSTVSDGATQTNYQVHAPNAGKQYISISSPGQLNESPYQVAVNLISAQGGEGSPDTTQFGEVEPNDIWTMATELTRDVPRFGQTRSLDDVDWYVINTHDNNSLMNVWFPGSDNTWNVEVQDANGAVLAEFPTVSDGITQTNQQVHAPNAGPQYIKITSPTGQLNQSNYQLAVNITGAEGGEGSPGYVYSGETEPNDYLLAADLLEPDQTIIGQSYAPDDVDWYMVEADANNTLFEFIFDNTATDFDIPNPVVTWDAEFTDSEGNVLASFTTLPGQLFSYEAQAPNAGNYYLRLVKTESTAVGFTDQPYRVTLVVTNEAGGSTQPNYNFYDVERENNDLFSRAKGLGSQESIINVKGQVMHDDDRDFFRIDSPNGNEIIKIEMCPQGTECYEDLNYGTPGSFAMLPWAVYLFDGAKVNDAFLNPYETKWYDASYGLDWVEIPLSPREIEEAREDEKCTPDVDYSPSGGISAACRNFELQGIPGWIPVESDHLFYLARFGVFGDGLIGMIDPTRPLNETNNSAWREISFAVQDPGIYYVGVSSVLAPSETYDNWEVVTREEEIDEEPDILVIKNLNYTADQYTFRITRTQLTPNYHDSGNDGRLGSDVEGGSNKDVKAILRGMSPFF